MRLAIAVRLNFVARSHRQMASRACVLDIAGGGGEERLQTILTPAGATSLSCSGIILGMPAWCCVSTGYRVSSTHANPLGTKTDAPFEVVWDIMRAWVKDHPVKAMVRACRFLSIKQ